MIVLTAVTAPRPVRVGGAEARKSFVMSIDVSCSDDIPGWRRTELELRSCKPFGLRLSPLLGETLFRPASIFAVDALAKSGGFDPDEVSPAKAVAARPIPVLLICGTRDTTIPCCHAEQIYRTASGPKELWVVNGAEHASALGHAPPQRRNRERNSAKTRKPTETDLLSGVKRTYRRPRKKNESEQVERRFDKLSHFSRPVVE